MISKKNNACGSGSGPPHAFYMHPLHARPAHLQLLGSDPEGEIGDAAGGPASRTGGVQLAPDGVGVHLRGPESGPASPQASVSQEPAPTARTLGREPGRQRRPPVPHRPPEGKASCAPQARHDSFPAPVRCTSPRADSAAASPLPPGRGARRYLGGTWGLGREGFKPQLTLLRPCGMVGARGAVCTTVFHSGPLAQAGRPPKPSPWASRLGRGRGA